MSNNLRKKTEEMTSEELEVYELINFHTQKSDDGICKLYDQDILDTLNETRIENKMTLSRVREILASLDEKGMIYDIPEEDEG